MSDVFNQLDRIRRGAEAPPDNETLPGSIHYDNVEFIYYQIPNGAPKRSVFKKIMSQTNVSFFTKMGRDIGGAVEDRVTIVTPSRMLFQCIKIHGDVSGWRKAIEFGAKDVGSLLAKINGNTLLLETGASFSLDDCEISFR